MSSFTCKKNNLYKRKKYTVWISFTINKIIEKLLMKMKIIIWGNFPSSPKAKIQLLWQDEEDVRENENGDNMADAIGKEPTWSIVLSDFLINQFNPLTPGALKKKKTHFLDLFCLF